MSFSKLIRLIQIASPLLVPILLMIVSGIIVNRADVLFENLLPFIDNIIKIKIWFFVIILMFISIPSILTSVHYYRAHKVAIKLNQLDEELLSLVREFKKTYRSPNLRNNPDPDAVNALKRLINLVLNRTVEVFYLFCECSVEVYLREPSNSQFLISWCRDTTSRFPHTFPKVFVGNSDQTKNGIVGHAFLTCNLKVVHILKKNGEWVADNQEYIFINEQKIVRQFPYRTLIAVPIMNGSDCQGVLCLYSMDTKVFDTKSVQELVMSIAGRIGSVLVITDFI